MREAITVNRRTFLGTLSIVGGAAATAGFVAAPVELIQTKPDGSVRGECRQTLILDTDRGPIEFKDVPMRFTITKEANGDDRGIVPHLIGHVELRASNTIQITKVHTPVDLGIGTFDFKFDMGGPKLMCLGDRLTLTGVDA